MRHPAAREIRVVGSPLKLSGDAPPDYAPPPTLGQHGEAILMHDLGVSREQVERLRLEEVI
jgi:formyl-CoA transferase